MNVSTQSDWSQLNLHRRLSLRTLLLASMFVAIGCNKDEGSPDATAEGDASMNDDATVSADSGEDAGTEDVSGGLDANTNIDAREFDAAEPTELLAFPGAMGFGAGATGGRFGEVRHVTTLEDSGPGSFRNAVEDDEAKVIVFDVSGIIRVRSNLEVGQNTTIAAQTSPGGITLYLFDRFDPDPDGDNGRLQLRGNTIVRHLRVRGSTYGRDAVFMLGSVENIMIDHMSVSWSGDESIAATNGFRNSTIQWTTVEEPLDGWSDQDEHNYGVKLTGTENGDISLYHTIIAHSIRRNPSMNFGGPRVGDVRANLLYNCSSGFKVEHGDAGEDEVVWGFYNVVSNYYQEGEASSVRMRDDTPIWLRNLDHEIHIYIAEHIDESLETDDITDHIFLEGPDLYVQVSEPIPVPYPAPAEITAAEARELALARAGAWPRDATTRRVLRGVEERNGHMVKMGDSGGRYNYQEWADDDGNDWPDVSAPMDSDGDGMPNAWEMSAGLDSNIDDSAATNLSAVGYSNIEVYINELADRRVGVE